MLRQKYRTAVDINVCRPSSLGMRVCGGDAARSSARTTSGAFCSERVHNSPHLPLRCLPCRHVSATAGRRACCSTLSATMTSEGFEAAARKGFAIAKLRRRLDLAPATQELQETFALRRILLKHGQRSEQECQSVCKFIAERTTMWREPFWPLLTPKEQLKVAGAVKLRMVAIDGEPHDCVVANATSGCMVFAALRGLAQVQCFDGTGTRLEFQPLETFGFLPVPDVLMEEATRCVEAVKTNPRSTVYRGEREYGERREAAKEAGKIRVKIAPGGQYLSVSGADVTPLLRRHAEKHGRKVLMKSMGLELPGMGGAGAVNSEGGNRKRESLMKEARYGVGSILVEEGMPPTTVFVIVEGECLIVKGRPKPKSSVTKSGARSARYNLGSSQSNRVDMVLTSGFHTQVDVCHLGSLGEKALIGDIPALLGGVQPASIIAKTPLRVLQCRAEKFAAHLDHNLRAKIVYVEASKARKARIEERGAEVERLLALKGTPLLIDTATPISVEPRRGCGTASGHRTNSKDNGKNVLVNDDEHKFDGDIPRERDKELASRSERRAPDAAEGDAGRGVHVLARHEAGMSSSTQKQARKQTSERGAEGVETAKARGTNKEAWDQDAVVGCSTSVTAAPRLLKASSAPATLGEIETEMGKALCPTPVTRRETLDVERVAATASVPLLPCFSQLRSSLTLMMGGRYPAPPAKIEGVGGARGSGDVATSETRRNVGLCTSAPAVETGRTPTLAANSGRISVEIGGGEGEVARVVKATTGQTARWSRLGGIGVIGAAEHTPPPTTAAARTAVSAAREHTQMLLASHLTPFPTITKNRSLHAVPQPIVTHSEGFADACTGETSQLGYAAWRLTTSARHDGLIPPAERQSIVRQIEAGFDALQGRRVSPLA